MVWPDDSVPAVFLGQGLSSLHYACSDVWVYTTQPFLSCTHSSSGQPLGGPARFYVCWIASALNRNMQIIYVRTGAVIHGFHPLGYERIRGVAPAVLAVVPDRSRAAEPPG